MNPHEKDTYCRRVEAGMNPIEAAEGQMVPWETVKRNLTQDPFFANRWRKAVLRQPEPKRREPKLVVELEDASPELLRAVRALIAREDAGDRDRNHCGSCGESLRGVRGSSDEAGPGHGCGGDTPGGCVVDIADHRHEPEPRDD